MFSKYRSWWRRWPRKRTLSARCTTSKSNSRWSWKRKKSLNTIWRSSRIISTPVKSSIHPEVRGRSTLVVAQKAKEAQQEVLIVLIILMGRKASSWEDQREYPLVVELRAIILTRILQRRLGLNSMMMWWWVLTMRVRSDLKMQISWTTKATTITRVEHHSVKPADSIHKVAIPRPCLTTLSVRSRMQWIGSLKMPRKRKPRWRRSGWRWPSRSCPWRETSQPSTPTHPCLVREPEPM